MSAALRQAPFEGRWSVRIDGNKRPVGVGPTDFSNLDRFLCDPAAIPCRDDR